MRRNYLHAYAIVRFEAGWAQSIPIDHRITIKKVVFDPRYAEVEVNRLNELNRDKGAYYFSQITRIEQPFAAGPDEPEQALDPDVSPATTETRS